MFPLFVFPLGLFLRPLAEHEERTSFCVRTRSGCGGQGYAQSLGVNLVSDKKVRKMAQEGKSGKGEVCAHKGVKMNTGAFRKFGIFASLAFVLFATVGVLNLRWVQEPLGRSFAFVIGRELARSAAVVFLFLSCLFLTAKSKKAGVLGLVGTGFLIVGQLVGWGILLGNERLLRDSLQLIGMMWEIVLIAGTVGWFFLFLSFVSLTRMGRWARMVAIWAVGYKFLVGACRGVGFPLCAWAASLLVSGQELDFCAWGACLNSDIVSCVSLGSSVLLFLSVLSLARGKVSEMGEPVPFSFVGRARRRDYWLWCLWCAIFQVVLAIPIWALYSRELMAKGSSVFWLWMVAEGLLQFLMMIPMCVCRLHDVGMSGWWLVLLWVGCWIPGLNIVAGIASFVIFGCLDGTVGPNRFGDDPRRRQVWVASPNVVVAPVTRPIAAPAERPDAKSPESRLAKVRELYEKGLLTEEEYKAYRAAIIAEI